MPKFKHLALLMMIGAYGRVFSDGVPLYSSEEALAHLKAMAASLLDYPDQQLNLITGLGGRGHSSCIKTYGSTYCSWTLIMPHHNKAIASAEMSWQLGGSQFSRTYGSLRVAVHSTVCFSPDSLFHSNPSAARYQTHYHVVFPDGHSVSIGKANASAQPEWLSKSYGLTIALYDSSRSNELSPEDRPNPRPIIDADVEDGCVRNITFYFSEGAK